MNHKLRLKKYNGKSGFTLAEILVVMAITAIVGTILVVIFTNTLRGSNKSQILAVIKQNGQSVLEDMDKNIRSADNLVCPTSGSSNTIVVVKDGAYTRYRIVLSSDTNAGSAPADCLSTVSETKNGCIAQDNPVKVIDAVTGELQTDTTFITDVCLPTSLMSSANILTDTNVQTGVKVNSGSFVASPSPGYKTAVAINFILSPGVNASSIVTSQIDPVTFQTTIGLR